MTISTELALRPEDRAVHGLELAEQVFTPERRKAIARFLNITPDDPALIPYLAISASYGLDPVMGQIWLIPQRVKVKDGDAENWVDRYRPAVGRDGYLAIARRDQRYDGLTAQVVCERDTFEVLYTGRKDDDPKVLHRFASKPVVFAENEAPDRWRGKVVGAWAKAWVKGDTPTFFYAPLREYMRMREKWEGKGQGRHRVLDDKGRPVLEPDGAWGFVSSMILKCAQSYVLRIAYGITGTVPGDELAGHVDGTATDEPELEAFDYERLNAGPDVIARLEAAVEAINALAPLSWAPAKLEMVTLGLTEPELITVAERIEREVSLLSERAGAPVGQPLNGVTSDPPADAQAVREPEPSSEPPSDGGGGSQEEVADAEVVGGAEMTSAPADEAEHIAALRVRLADLEERIDLWAADTEEYSELAAEIDQVSAELEAHDNPNQDSLGFEE